jgi:hypothetical protein
VILSWSSRRTRHGAICLLVLRDILHTLNRQVALGAKRTSKGGQPWMDQLRLNQTRQWLWPGVKATPSASEVLRLQSSSRSGRRRECIGCVSRGSKLWISGIGSSVDPAVEASIAATRFLSHCLSDSSLLPMYSERTSVRKPPKYRLVTAPTEQISHRLCSRATRPARKDGTAFQPCQKPTRNGWELQPLPKRRFWPRSNRQLKLHKGDRRTQAAPA